jgi:4-amino-4-deoxy-L-arabinose transferase-like glycosyltransferase
VPRRDNEPAGPAVTAEAAAAKPAAARRRAARYGFALVLLWAFALRIWHASIQLDEGRFWDERFPLQNIESLLRWHTLWPANAFHPTFSYIPCAVLLGIVEGLHRLTGSPALAVLKPDGFTPLSYFLVRFLQAVWGVASIAWLARVGRRAFDRETGLIAGLLLAATPWHIRQSVIYKPDILLLFIGIVAIDLSITAVLRPRPRTFVDAGIAVGLGLATKFNAAPIALPLTIGTLLRKSQRWRRLLGLVLAGVVAVAIFAALDVHLFLRPEMLQRDFVAGTLNDYAHKGASTTRWQIVLHAGRSLLSPTFHGALIGTVALVGYVWCVVAAIRSSERRRAVLATALVYPLTYVLIYAVITTNPSAHNWLFLLPFTSLAAAAALVRVGKVIASRAPAAARVVLPTAAALLVLVTVVPASAYVYRNTVPSTWSVADRVIGAETAGSPQTIVVWHSDDRHLARPLGPANARLVVVPASQWRKLQLPPAGADVEIYDLERVPAPASATGDRTRSVEPAPFRAHGSPLLVVFHPWNQTAPPRELPLRDGCFAAPELAGGTAVSFEVALARVEKNAVDMRWGEQRVPLFWGGRTRTSQRWISPRLTARMGSSPICITGPQKPVRRVSAWTWTR